MNAVLRGRRVLLLVSIFALLLGVAAFAQQSGESASKPSQKQSQEAQPAVPKKAEQPPPASSGTTDLNQEFGKQLAQESAEASGAHPAKPEEENAQEKMVEGLKQSAAVQWMASKLHISPQAGYWVGIILDFVLLALLILWGVKKKVPAMFRTRTQTIQRGLEEARKASAEANQRLSEIEARLAKLDSEVAAMRTTADQDMAAEEQRIRAATEQDTKRVVESAEAEIAAAAKQAQRELKAFAVDLAVTLAERRIKVDVPTDQALVRGFISELGAAGAGKAKDGE